jgi:hypothetical protein
MDQKRQPPPSGEGGDDNLPSEFGFRATVPDLPQTRTITHLRHEKRKRDDYQQPETVIFTGGALTAVTPGRGVEEKTQAAPQTLPGKGRKTSPSRNLQPKTLRFPTSSLK